LLRSGGVLILIGLLGMAFASYCPDPGIGISSTQQNILPIFIGLICYPILRSTFSAIMTERPRKIQAAVISVLKSLILLDAVQCYLVAGNRPIFAIVVASLLLPSLCLGKIIRST
ncbi:MAG: hypothetical protein AAF939_16800, partial [Planctomycetota bacterium]